MIFPLPVLTQSVKYPEQVVNSLLQLVTARELGDELLPSAVLESPCEM